MLFIMIKKIINLNGLEKEKIMSPSEMKNLTGGSLLWCRCDGENQWVSCSTASDCDPRLCPGIGSKCY
jgi:natural product precursor